MDRLRELGIGGGTPRSIRQGHMPDLPCGSCTWRTLDLAEIKDTARDKRIPRREQTHHGGPAQETSPGTEARWPRIPPPGQLLGFCGTSKPSEPGARSHRKCKSCRDAVHTLPTRRDMQSWSVSLCPNRRREEGSRGQRARHLQPPSSAGGIQKIGSMRNWPKFRHLKASARTVHGAIGVSAWLSEHQGNRCKWLKRKPMPAAPISAESCSLPETAKTCQES